MKKSKSHDQATTEAVAPATQPEASQPEAPKQAPAAPQGTQVAPAKASAKKDASPKKNAPKAKKGAKKAAPKKQAKETGKKAAKQQDAKVPREFSKKAVILDLLRRPKGATLGELMAATGWQKHSIRGFISGTLGKKMDLPVVSAKREDGARVYSLAK